MKNVFMCSLCHNGVLGGALYLEPDLLIYKTNKLTVDKRYKNLVMPLKDIKNISWRWILFPVATLEMQNGEKYRIMIYNKTRFMRCFMEYFHKTEG